ncbi:MAG: Mth938-like domain-containing protein [Desulfobulbaceae bacterium]
MAAITSYSFGRMVIDGTPFTGDVLIFPDGSILNPWWRAAGHRLVMEDLEKLLAASPEVIIAGTGASGLMKPAADLESKLRAMGIEFIALPTADAVTVFNETSARQRAGGCFHLTC